MNKYNYLLVIQGYYQKRKDLSAYENYSEARSNLKAYKNNEIGRYRLIKRRELNT